MYRHPLSLFYFHFHLPVPWLLPVRETRVFVQEVTNDKEIGLRTTLRTLHKGLLRSCHIHTVYFYTKCFGIENFELLKWRQKFRFFLNWKFYFLIFRFFDCSNFRFPDFSIYRFFDFSILYFLQFLDLSNFRFFEYTIFLFYYFFNFSISRLPEFSIFRFSDFCNSFFIFRFLFKIIRVLDLKFSTRVTHTRS